MINYWAKLCTSNDTKLSTVLYKLIHTKYLTGEITTKWICCVKKILDENGFSNIFDFQGNINYLWLKTSLKRRILDQFIQCWKAEIFESSKGLSYRIFKTEWKFEEYLDLLEKKDRMTFCKFRTTNHKLPIEIGRWYSVNRNDRKCLLCNKNDLGDEFHYIFECPYFKITRKQCLGTYFRKRVNVCKFKDSFQNKNQITLRKLCKFINVINKQLCPP